MDIGIALTLLAVGTILALVVSCATLALLFLRPHPDLLSVRQDVLDLMDKVEHWRKRDSMRRAREALPEEQIVQPQPVAVLASDAKAALRARAGLSVGHRS